MPEREHEADRDRPFSLLHQLAGHVVDGGNVVRVHGMTQAKTVSKKRGSEEHRVAMEGNAGPNPRAQVEGE